MSLQPGRTPCPGEESPLQIAVDGPAGAGKSTIGKGLAAALGCPYLDTGLMYRAVTREAFHCGVPPSDGAALAHLARHISFSLTGPGQSLHIGDSIPESELRAPAVEAAVSEVSAHPQVREALVERQRAMAFGRCIVMVGRDIGTVVLPDASIKFWVTASPEERARRRLIEEPDRRGREAQGLVLEAIRTRDEKDAARTVSPLRQAPDAVVIATDELTPDEALLEAIRAIESRSRQRIPITEPTV